jgi:hypothetical protein
VPHAAERGAIATGWAYDREALATSFLTWEQLSAGVTLEALE